MPLTAVCPNPACGKPSYVPAKHAGQVRCPHCRTGFTVAPAVENTAAPTIAPPAGDTPKSLTGVPALRPSVVQTPATIGRFEIRATLGAGACGVVYRAYDPNLEREVALKVPHPGSLDDQRRKRFVVEGKAAAKLSHPHIVPVYETGFDGTHQFIASAFINGRTLAEALRIGPFDFCLSAEIVRDLAGALAHAHERGVIHRDVKPGNVMLDAKGHPYLTDFGLARQENAKRLTRLGSFLGTPGYMAPEMAQGATGDCNAACDQYSLGVVLYELLCGQTPFSGPAEIVLYNVVKMTPPSPSSVNPNVPKELEAICLKAMAKNPAERYANCASLANALRAWLDRQAKIAEPITVRAGQPLAAPAPTNSGRGWLSVLLGLSGAFVIALMLSVAIVYMPLPVVPGVPEPPVPVQPDREFSDLLEQGRKALQEDRFTDAENAFQQAFTLKPNETGVEALLVLAQTKRRDAEKTKADVEKRVSGLLAEAQALQKSDDLPAARKKIDEASKLGPLMVNVREAYATLAIAERGAKEVADRNARFTKLLDDVQASLEKGDVANARGKMNEASKLGVVPQNMKTLVEEAEEAVRAANIAAAKKAADAQVALGDDALTKSRFRDAVKHYDSAAQILEDAESTPQVVQWRFAVAKSIVKAERDWEFARKNPEPVFSLKGPFTQVVISADANRFVAGGFKAENPWARVWNAQTRQEEFVTMIFGTKFSGRPVAISDDGKFFATATAPGTGASGNVRVWDTENRKQIMIAESRTRHAAWVTMSGDGKRLAISWDAVDIWNTETGQKIATLTTADGRPFTGGKEAMMSGDGKRVVIVSVAPGTLARSYKLWNAETGKEIATPAVAAGVTSCAVISRDGKYLVTGSKDKGAQLWNADTGAEIKAFKGHTGDVLGLAISRDSECIVTCSRGWPTKVWHRESGKEIAWLGNRDWPVWGVIISADGKRVVTASRDYAAKGYENSAKVWDAETGKEIANLKGIHSGYLGGVLAISSDGNRIVISDATADKASTTAARGVKIWDLERDPQPREPNKKKGLPGLNGGGAKIKTGSLSGVWKGTFSQTGIMDRDLTFAIFASKGSNGYTGNVLIGIPNGIPLHRGTYAASFDGRKFRFNEAVPLDFFSPLYPSYGLPISGELEFDLRTDPPALAGSWQSTDPKSKGELRVKKQ